MLNTACSLAFHSQDLDSDGSLQRIPLSEVQSCHLIGHRFALIACKRVSHGLADDVFHLPSKLALPPTALLLRRLVIDLPLQPPPPLPSFTPHQQWPWHLRASASGKPGSAYPARTTVAVAPTRCVGLLFITTDSMNSAVVCSMTSRVEGQPMPHSPTTGGRDHQRATGFR